MTDQAPTLQPAYGALAALLVEMREGWDLDQVLRELIGCPWSPRLVLEAYLAARDDPSNRLDVRHAVVRFPSEAPKTTPEQYDTEHAHAQRILNRHHGDHTP